MDFGLGEAQEAYAGQFKTRIEDHKIQCCGYSGWKSSEVNTPLCDWIQFQMNLTCLVIIQQQETPGGNNKKE